MSTFALVDCNNFYASCERAFNPALEKKPVVVLSNNDGCIIARSNEAKKLGIPMGAPFFKWKKLCLENNVHVFSSNYELYGDMSRRVMVLLRIFCPEMEIYSIDEAFLLFDGFTENEFINQATQIRHKIKMCTGIPVSIGLAPTKTLAKIANYMAKNHSRAGIFNLCDNDLREKILKKFPVEKIWGVGGKLSSRLKKLNINSAKDLRDADSKMLRLQFGVIMEKIVAELRGISCVSLESAQARKQIISSRSFGKAVTALNDIEEAISHYTNIACSKLRKQKSLASGISVFLRTNIFNENHRHDTNYQYFPFPVPTADTAYIIRSAKKCVQHIYKKDLKYHKAGLILLDLQPDTIQQQDLFTQTDNQKNSNLLKAVDSINKVYGKGTVFYCAEGIARQWQIKSDKRSLRCTTRWNEILGID